MSGAKEPRGLPTLSGIIAISALTLILTLGLASCGGDDDPVSPPIPTIYESDQLQLPTLRTDWHPASMPVQLEDQDYLRGKLLWHHVREIRPTDDIFAGDTIDGDYVHTLRLIYRPAAYVDPSAGNSKSWAGITTYFDEDIFQSTQYLEIRLRGTHGRLHLDLGRISEDLDGDGIAFTEDLDQNATASEEEDVGLDGLPDEQEGTTDNPYDPVTNPDPAGDNWYFLGAGKCPVPGGCESIDWESDQWYYEYLNGTEGNRHDPSVVGLPDQEALTSTGFKTANSYFSYVLDVASDRFLVPNSEYNGWKTYRIPLRDETAIDETVDIDGEPALDRPTHVRIWFDSEESQMNPDTVEVALLQFSQPAGLSLYAVRDYAYQTRRVFHLGLEGELLPSDSISLLHVFQSENPLRPDPEAIPANLWVDPNDPGAYPGEDQESLGALRVVQLHDTAFTYHDDPERNLHYVVFQRPRDRDRHLACYLEVIRDGDTIVFGNIEADTLYELKLLAPARVESSPTQQTWELMWRNCYRLPEDFFNTPNTELSIRQGLPGTEYDLDNPEVQYDAGSATPFIQILGLDQYDLSGNRVPDGLIDNRPDIYWEEHDLLVFPSFRPFDSDTTFVDQTGETSPPLSEKVPLMYNSTSFEEIALNSKYYLLFMLHDN